MTTTPGGVTSVATTIGLTEPLDARAVSEGLDQARVRWFDANIATYRLTVAEILNFWSAGCTWIIVASEGVVTETKANRPECPRVEWTVEQLHEMVSGWIDEVSEFASPEFGEHTLAVRFDDNGVPVTMEFDLANGVDEETSMRVTFRPLP